MIDFTNFEEVKTAFPINAIYCLPDYSMQITGYYFDTKNWWPANLVEGVMVSDKGLIEIPAPQMRNKY